MKKSLIEEPSVKLLELFDQVSEEARIEKNAVPPINNMLYWWTRKPLIVSRAITLTSTLDNIEDVRSLLQLNREKRAYTYTPDVGVYKKKLGRDPSEIKVLDPFGGAGNLIFEAKYLGLDCTISDYNAVAYLLEKAVLEYPAKYGVKLADDFEKYANQVIELTKKEIGKFFKDNQLNYLWLWCIKCPHCNQRVPLTNQMWIAKKSTSKIGMRFRVTSNKNFTTELVPNMSEEEGEKFTKKGLSAICISCKNTIDYKTMTNDIATRNDREMTIIQVRSNKKRNYVLAREEDKKLFQDTLKYFELKRKDFENEDLIPNENILPSHRRENNLWHYGIKNWSDYYSHRQLLTHSTFLKYILLICKKIKDKELAKIISLYLGCLLCRTISSDALGVLWNPVGEKSQPVLSLRRPSIAFNHAEINPFEKIPGSFPNMLENIKNAIIFASKSPKNIIILNQSVTKLSSLSDRYDLIITDPPYGDDVQYAELSEFFYVWMYRCLKQNFPELPSRIPLAEDFCESWGRFGDKKLAADFFKKGLKKSFVSINQALKDDGLLVVFFAHSTVNAWNIFLESIINSKFQVISSYAIHTENVTNVLARNKTSFMSSIVVVCRKISKESTAFFEDIIPQTEDRIKNLIDKISGEEILAVPITDLLIMVYGKVLETCTQFSELKSYEKDFKPDFETLIKGSQDFIMRELVAKLTGRNMNLIGPEMAFYLLVRIFYRGKMAADDAIKITRAITVDLNKLEKEGMIIIVGGVTNLTPLQETNLELRPEELDSANLYQQLCYLATICQTKGASKVSAILSQSAGNIKADELKKIVPLLIKSYRLQINKNQKLADSEQEELKILETISDTWGGTKIEGTLDGFVEK